MVERHSVGPKIWSMALRAPYLGSPGFWDRRRASSFWMVKVRLWNWTSELMSFRIISFTM